VEAARPRRTAQGVRLPPRGESRRGGCAGWGVRGPGEGVRDGRRAPHARHEYLHRLYGKSKRVAQGLRATHTNGNASSSGASLDDDDGNSSTFEYDRDGDNGADLHTRPDG